MNGKHTNRKEHVIKFNMQHKNFITFYRITCVSRASPSQHVTHISLKISLGTLCTHTLFKRQCALHELHSMSTNIKLIITYVDHVICPLSSPQHIISDFVAFDIRYGDYRIYCSYRSPLDTCWTILLNEEKTKGIHFHFLGASDLNSAEETRLIFSRRYAIV